jgi:hypothetical protein
MISTNGKKNERKISELNITENPYILNSNFLYSKDFRDRQVVNLLIPYIV